MIIEIYLNVKIMNQNISDRSKCPYCSRCVENFICVVSNAYQTNDIKKFMENGIVHLCINSPRCNCKISCKYFFQKPGAFLLLQLNEGSRLSQYCKLSDEPNDILRIDLKNECMFIVNLQLDSFDYSINQVKILEEKINDFDLANFLKTFKSNLTSKKILDCRNSETYSGRFKKILAIFTTNQGKNVYSKNESNFKKWFDLETNILEFVPIFMELSTTDHNEYFKPSEDEILFNT